MKLNKRIRRTSDLLYKGVTNPGKIPGFLRSQAYKPIASRKIPYTTEESLLESEEVEWRMQPEEIRFEHSIDTVPEALYNSFISGLYPNNTFISPEDCVIYQPPDRFVKKWDEVIVLKVPKGDRKHEVIYFNQDGEVVGPLVNSVDERVKPSLISKFTYASKQMRLPEFIDITAGKSTQREYETVDTAVCLASRTSMNYGHWVLEHLPKLIKANQILDLPPKVLMKQPKGWQSETLDLLGVPQNDRIYLEDQPVRVKNFIQTDIKPVYSRDFELCPEDYRALSEAMKNSIHTEGEYARRIFVSRQNVGRRCVNNMNDVETVLEEYDFTIIHPEELSIKQQIKQFHNANMIMGPIGSGLANMIFSLDVDIYPIIDSSWISGFFFALSQAMGYDCYPIYSKSTEINRKEPHPYTSGPINNIEVNIDLLTSILERSINK